MLLALAAQQQGPQNPLLAAAMAAASPNGGLPGMDFNPMMMATMQLLMASQAGAIPPPTSSAASSLFPGGSAAALMQSQVRPLLATGPTMFSI